MTENTGPHTDPPGEANPPEAPPGQQRPPKGPRRTETRIAGAIRIARAHPDRCDALLKLLDAKTPAFEADCRITTAEVAHARTMLKLRAERDFAREVEPLSPDLIAIVRASVLAVKAQPQIPNACASPAPEGAGDLPPEAPTTQQGIH